MRKGWYSLEGDRGEGARPTRLESSRQGRDRSVVAMLLRTDSLVGNEERADPGWSLGVEM